MAFPVSLKKVVDEIEKSMEGYQAFINQRTGELFGTDVGLMEEGIGEEDLPAWMRQEGTNLREVVTSDDWLALPPEFRCETAAEIERFCKKCLVGETQHVLMANLQSGISVGLLKAKLVDLGVYEDWKEFRRERMAEMAAAWLTKKGIAFRK